MNAFFLLNCFAFRNNFYFFIFVVASFQSGEKMVYSWWVKEAASAGLNSLDRIDEREITQKNAHNPLNIKHFINWFPRIYSKQSFHRALSFSLSRCSVFLLFACYLYVCVFLKIAITRRWAIGFFALLLRFVSFRFISFFSSICGDWFIQCKYTIPMKKNSKISFEWFFYWSLINS